MKPYITRKQEIVLTTIRDYYLDNGVAPSLGELQKLLNISSKRGVVNHLNALEKKGYIMRNSSARGITIVDEEEYEYLLGIPILGYANAGKPLAIAEEDYLGSLKVDKSLLPHKENLFALVVSGDSMNKQEIDGTVMNTGSYIVVAKDVEIHNGDSVVAILDNSATVKCYKNENGTIILYPNSTNDIHTPIYLDRYSSSLINGKVIKVLPNPHTV